MNKYGAIHSFVDRIPDELGEKEVIKRISESVRRNAHIENWTRKPKWKKSEVDKTVKEYVTEGLKHWRKTHPPESQKKFSTNPMKYWHVVMNARIPRGTKVRTVRFGADILARMDTWVANGQRNWQVRSLLFPKAKYTAKRAAAWATAHDYTWIKVEG